MKTGHTLPCFCQLHNMDIHNFTFFHAVGVSACDLIFFSTVHRSIELFYLPTLIHKSLFINNIYIYIYIYILLMNKELCIKVGK